MSGIDSFENLNIWKKAKDLLLELYSITENFPKSEKFVLTSQLRRSALSIPANIAEGHGRYHFSESINFLLIARGSLQEARSHLLIAKELGYLDEEKFDKINKEYLGLLKGINSFIKSVRDNKKKIK